MLNIAIDGPSGAGKSTIAKEVAKRLNITYLDTGAMYRAIGLKVDRMGVSCADIDGVVAVLADTTLDITYDNGAQRIFLDGEDVSEAIREHKVSKLASDVSKIPQVRLKLVDMQRDIATKCDLVLDGRDITSYVLPQANYKFYLTAEAEERAKRRVMELQAKGQQVDYDGILKDIVDRDNNDMNRAFAPLVRTADSVYIDTTHMSIEQVIEAIISKVNIVK